jgi:large subunit ribosomal protein L4
MPSAPRVGGSGTVDLEATAFEARWNGPLVHECVRADLNARRQGTASTKNRAAVRGGGAKPWRQKGTGRARQGSMRAPQFAGGGTVFGPSPRHYTVKVNRKARRAALRSALSLHATRSSVGVLDVSGFATPSTKQAAELLGAWERPGRALVLLSEGEFAAGKSFRNIDRITVLETSEAGVADIVGAASLLVTEQALSELTARAVGTTEEAA